MRKITIDSPNGCGAGTRVLLEDGTDIGGSVEAISVDRFGADDVVRVQVTLALCALDIKNAPAGFVMAYPGTTEPQSIRRIEFADGRVFECCVDEKGESNDG